jgi:putative MATE family efflux protein
MASEVAPTPRAAGALSSDGTQGPHGPQSAAGASLDVDRTFRLLVFTLAWRVIVEQLLQTALGFVDLLMVSRLGADAIAGVGASVQIVFIIIACISAIGTGTTVLVARFIGAGEPQQSSRVVKQSFLLAVALGLVLAVVGVPTAHWQVAALGVEPAVVELGGAYLRVSYLAAGALTLSLVLGSALRGAGDSRTPMLVALGVNAVNVAAAYGLIFGHLGLPELGVVGSAWAAALARGAGSLALIVLLVRGVGRSHLRLAGRHGWWPDVGLVARIMRVGVPSMAEQLSRSVGMLLFSEVVISLGTAVFAAQRITFNIIGISFLPGFGFSISATALTGQALGAGNPERARRATWFSVRSACLWQGGMGVLFLVAAPLFIRIFTDDPAIVAYGAEGLRVLALGQPQTAISQVLAGGLRGAGDTRYPMVVTALSMWLLRLPLAWFCVEVLHWGLAGAYVGFVVGSTIEALAEHLRYRAGKWQRLKV